MWVCVPSCSTETCLFLKRICLIYSFLRITSLRVRALHPLPSWASSLLEESLQGPFNGSTWVPTKLQCMSFKVYHGLVCSDASHLLWVLTQKVCVELQKKAGLINGSSVCKVAPSTLTIQLVLVITTMVDFYCSIIHFFFLCVCAVCNIPLALSLMCWF